MVKMKIIQGTIERRTTNMVKAFVETITCREKERTRAGESGKGMCVCVFVCVFVCVCVCVSVCV